MESLIIRRALSSEVDSFIQWGLDEGWNMPKDPPTYFASYPEGWLVAEIGDVVVGKLYSTSYPSGLGHIGYIIVGVEWRGKGVGTALLRHILDSYLTVCSLGVGLYSSADELPFYRNMGFEVMEKVFRMSLTLSSESQLAGLIDDESKIVLDEELVIQDMDPETDLEKVAKYDASLTGAYRPLFWAQLPRSHVALVLSLKTREIIGVGALRSLTNSTRLGPIYAKSTNVAVAIFSKLMEQVPCDIVNLTVDAFCGNSQAINLLWSKGFLLTNECFLLLRPFNGVEGGHLNTHPSAISRKHIFAITSLDFN